MGSSKAGAQRERPQLLEGEQQPREDCPPWGDREGFLAELYRSESPRLIRLLSRQMRCREEARDLVQDVFCRFARAHGPWSSSLDRPQAYIRRIAANLLKDRVKKDRRHSVPLHVVADEEALAGHDPHGLLESRDMLRRIETAMMRLRPRTREVFMANRIEGLSYGEIAERTGLSVKGVEKQMSRALVQLDRILSRL